MARSSPRVFHLLLIAGLAVIVASATVSPASARQHWSGEIKVKDTAAPEAVNFDGAPFPGAWDALDGHYRLRADFDVRQEGSDKDNSGTEFELTGGGMTFLDYALNWTLCESVLNPDTGSCAGAGDDVSTFVGFADASASGRLAFALEPRRARQTLPVTLFLPDDPRPFGDGPKPPKPHTLPTPFVIGLDSLLGTNAGGLPLPDVYWERTATESGCPNGTVQVREDEKYHNGVETVTRSGDTSDDGQSCLPPATTETGAPASLSLWPARTWFDQVITEPGKAFHGLSDRGCTLKSANHLLFQDYSICGFYDSGEPVDEILGKRQVFYDVVCPFEPYLPDPHDQVDDLWIIARACSPYNGFGGTIWHRSLMVRYDLKLGR